jgi:hypothetical protein
MSYRAFDNSRYKGLVNSLPIEQRSEFEGMIPDKIEERYETLTKLSQVIGSKKYIRSNPLPMQDICALKAGEFTLWINPKVDPVLIDKNILKLNTDYPGSILSPEYMQPFLQMREFYLIKETAKTETKNTTKKTKKTKPVVA